MNIYKHKYVTRHFYVSHFFLIIKIIQRKEKRNLMIKMCK